MHFVAATPWHLSPTQDHFIHSAFCCCNLLVYTQIESYCLHTQFYYQWCWIIQVSDVGWFICLSLMCRLAGLHCNLPYVQLPEHLCLIQLQDWLLADTLHMSTFILRSLLHYKQFKVATTYQQLLLLLQRRWLHHCTWHHRILLLHCQILDSELELLSVRCRVTLH